MKQEQATVQEVEEYFSFCDGDAAFLADAAGELSDDFLRSTESLGPV